MKKIGALEAGGTKMVLAVYDEAMNELDRISLPTEDPSVTMPKMKAFFDGHQVDALGVGSFGPAHQIPHFLYGAEILVESFCHGSTSL